MSNTNEAVNLIVNVPAPSRSMFEMIRSAAVAMLANNSAMPEEFEDCLTMEIFTRPSGSQYVVVNLA